MPLEIILLALRKQIKHSTSVPFPKPIILLTSDLPGTAVDVGGEGTAHDSG